MGGALQQDVVQSKHDISVCTGMFLATFLPKFEEAVVMTHGRPNLVWEGEIACVQNHVAAGNEELASVVHLHFQSHLCLSECAVKTEDLYVKLPAGSVLVVLSVLHGPVRQGHALCIEARGVSLEDEGCRG